MMAVAQQAQIEWLDDDGNVSKTETHHRSLVSLLGYLGKIAMGDEEAAKTKRVAVFLIAKGAAADMDKGAELPFNKETTRRDGDDLKLVIAEGTLEEVVANLAGKAVPPPMAMMKLQMLISQLAEISDMKGIIITAVFGEEVTAAAGFGFISESIEVTNADMIILAEAAANQVDMFREEMRKTRNITFPTDSVIITPAQARAGGVPDLRKLI